MNGFRYVLVYEGEVINASESLDTIKQAASDSEVATWQTMFYIYRYGERVGQLFYHPSLGWWNMGQWADIEGAL